MSPRLVPSPAPVRLVFEALAYASATLAAGRDLKWEAWAARVEELEEQIDCADFAEDDERVARLERERSELVAERCWL